MNDATRAVVSALARLLSRGKLLTFIFHRIAAEQDPLLPHTPDSRTFDLLMASVAEIFQVLPLDEAVDRLTRNSLPRRAVCITFDDGYANNHDEALPILQRYHLPATFFVASGFIDGGIMWNDMLLEAVRGARDEMDVSDIIADGVYPTRSIAEKRATFAALLRALKYQDAQARNEKACGIWERFADRRGGDTMLTSAKLKALNNAGMLIGGHTVSHPILHSLTTARARAEIADNKAQLESIIGDKVTLFAYPNGQPHSDYGREHVTILKQLGFTGAVCTARGVADRNTDVFQLPRFTPWDRSPVRFCTRALSTYVAPRPEAV